MELEMDNQKAILEFELELVKREEIKKVWFEREKLEQQRKEELENNNEILAEVCN